jgi:hypothetical protein
MQPASIIQSHRAPRKTSGLRPGRFRHSDNDIRAFPFKLGWI